MTATFGKLEGRIVVPSGGWDVAAEDTGGTFTATISAGNYYLSSADTKRSFIDELEWKLNSAGSDTWAVTISAGEDGTGKTTISNDGSTCAVTWSTNTTDPRDLLGFDVDLSGATSYTSAGHARPLWLPNCPFINLNGGDDWEGWHEMDIRQTEDPQGNVYSLFGERKKVLELHWDAIKQAKTWVASETTTNESYESFLLGTLLGEDTWSRVGGPVRWYPDADADTQHTTYRVILGSTWKPTQFKQNWSGYFRLSLPRLVAVPGASDVGNSPPSASATTSVSGLAVDFTDTSTDSDGTVSSWSWDFGDGSTSASQNPSHTYPSTGSYTWELIVADDDGARGRTTGTVTVTGTANTHSLLLDGSTQYLKVADTAALEPGSAFSLELWAKITSYGTETVYANKWDGAGNNAVLIQCNGTTTYLYISGDGSTTGYQATWTAAPATGAWHHVAVTYDSSAGGKLYIDAVDQGAPSETGSPLAVYNGSAPWTFGCFKDGGGRFLNGKIDDLRIWSDARTATEISNHYQQELTGAETGLALYAALDNNYTDRGPNALTITAIGSPTFSSSDLPF